MPEEIELYWLGLYHPACSCYLDWGVKRRGNWRERLDSFLSVAVGYPCPYHGSATGLPAGRERGFIYWRANCVYYRPLAEGQKDNARRNALVARARAA